MTVAEFRAFGSEVLVWVIGAVVVGEILYLMIKAQFWSPLRDQQEKPAPPPESEKPPESLPDATFSLFGMLAAMLALWLGDDEPDLIEILAGVPLLLGPALWNSRRRLTWPVAAAWLGGGGALVAAAYLAVTRLPAFYHPWSVGALAVLGLAGVVHSSAKGEPQKPLFWVFFLVMAFIFWLAERNGAALFVVAFVILAPLVQWLRRKWWRTGNTQGEAE